MCIFAIFTYLAFGQISPYFGPLYEELVGDNGFIFVSFCRSNLVAPISRKELFVKNYIMTREQQHNWAGSGIFPVNFCCIFTGSNNLRFHGNEHKIEKFGTSYVGFGSHPTYAQKIMKIPDIAWPTFF